MIYAEMWTDRIAVTLPPTYNEMIKRVPGARYKDNVWTTPLSWAACVQLRAEFGQLLDIGPQLSEWAFTHLQRRNDVIAFKEGQYTYGAALSQELRAYQLTGASWLMQAGRALLGDAPRVGKTPQMLVALRASALNGKTLVVAPNSVKFTWGLEAQVWYPEAKVTVLHGSAAQKAKQIKEGADIFTINWESIRTLSRLAGYGSLLLSDKEKKEGPLNTVDWYAAIADEAHRMADPKAKQTRAMWYLFWQATLRYGLTGTPVVNRGADLWSIMHGLAPEEYPVRSSWIDRYFNSGQGRFGWEVFGLKPDTYAEFHEILKPRFLRRTREEVDSQITQANPPQIRWVELGVKQKAAYTLMKKEQLLAEEGGILAVSTPLERDLRLGQIANGTPVIEDGAVVALTTPSVKLDALWEIMDESPEEPLIVFSPSKLAIRFIKEQMDKKKIESIEITGDIDPQLRAANIAKFQMGMAQVALCTTGAGAEGITLSRANTVVFVGLPGSMVQFLQAKERAEAVGKERPVDVILVLARDTVDEKDLARLDMKQEYLQEVTQDGERGRES